MNLLSKIALGVGYFLLVTLLLILWIDQSRSVYCSSAGCITVWRRLGGRCYVIHGKYYWIRPPTSSSYVSTVNWEYLAFFYNKALPKTIVVMDPEDNKWPDDHFSISNSSADEWKFVSYADQYNSLLYTSKDVRTRQPTEGTIIMWVDIGEGKWGADVGQ